MSDLRGPSRPEQDPILASDLPAAPKPILTPPAAANPLPSHLRSSGRATTRLPSASTGQPSSHLKRPLPQPPQPAENPIRTVSHQRVEEYYPDDRVEIRRQIEERVVGDVNDSWRGDFPSSTMMATASPS
ncbi:MAG: hypothetical protein M1813_007354 [Trichoglossum hirsutum]|nr:MAG: hypothetical protein M1813_007354 [Trichoglossum hirsutum]